MCGHWVEDHSGQLLAPAIPGRRHAAGLERHAGVALHVEAPLDDAVGGRECAFGLADRDVERARQIVAERRMQQRRVRGDRGLGGRDRGQRLDVELDRVHAIVGRGAAGGDDDGDRLADVADDAVGQNRLRARPQRGMRDDGMDTPHAEVAGIERRHDAARSHARGVRSMASRRA